MLYQENGYAIIETGMSLAGVQPEYRLYSTGKAATLPFLLLLMFCSVYDDLLQLGFKMFLGFSPVITNWSAASDEFSLILDNNPMAEFAELPEGHEGLLFSNILCGVLRGALEMVRLLAGREICSPRRTNVSHKAK